MDFDMKQWRNHPQQQQHESEDAQQPSAKIPKLLHDPQQYSSSFTTCTATAPLPLFAPEPVSKISHLSAFPDSTQLTSSASVTARSFPKMGGSYFSSAQWQELELQALIYRYMLAGATVPPELLNPIKKSLLHSPTYFLHHPLQHYSYYQPALLQTGYWGRAAMDPEPGRCRRTDGKKWRCSRDVVAGQKYCERHVHRGRNRSRKPVEIPTPTSSANTTTCIGISGGGGAGVGAFKGTSSLVAPSPAPGSHGTSFSFSGQSPSTELFHLKNNGLSDAKPETTGFLGPRNEVGNRSDGHVLRHFFDDWPRSAHEPDGDGGSNANQTKSATCLSISMPGNSSSDVSLKLATGDGDESEGHGHRSNGREQPQVNWSGGWATTQVASMGGPLAEVLRSSTSNSSPTSVLHHLPRGSASETSFVST